MGHVRWHFGSCGDVMVRVALEDHVMVRVALWVSLWVM